ncbi:MAG: Gfo/Idh/MocA family oxidoreductase [Fimbriimonas sp.]|nr:Gfo/Idh/MocA family oxidoreductase [Fimbriimonas sp.]
MKIAIVGVGSFAQCFIPLYKAHPLVSKVVLADLDPEKLEENRQKHGIQETYGSLEDVLASDVDAVALITQNWMHGPQAVQALKAGKAVYSAVPAGITVQEVEDIVRTVEATGQIYMIGETSYYYPGAIYCRRRFAEGGFGQVVYSEGEYYHDWDHGLYEVMKARAGDRWREEGGMPPMHYPTHSTGGILSILGTYATHVSCQGFVDHDEDGIYAPGANAYDNPFSNQSGLFKMADGSMMRVNEFRRIGSPGAERMSMFGTEGCYHNTHAGQVWTDKNTVTRLEDILSCADRSFGDLENPFADMSQVHEIERLPKEFAGLPNGHQGSHQFLVDDFVKAVIEKKHPPNSVWQAARYLVPGLVAHQSAMRGGELLPVPDFGSGS